MHSDKKEIPEQEQTSETAEDIFSRQSFSLHENMGEEDDDDEDGSEVDVSDLLAEVGVSGLELPSGDVKLPDVPPQAPKPKKRTPRSEPTLTNKYDGLVDQISEFISQCMEAQSAQIDLFLLGEQNSVEALVKKFHRDNLRSVDPNPDRWVAIAHAIALWISDRKGLFTTDELKPVVIEAIETTPTPLMEITWYEINQRKLARVLTNHDQVQLLREALEGTEFEDLFTERSVTIPPTPPPGTKRSRKSSGTTRKKGKSGRDHLLESSTTSELMEYFKGCDSSPFTQKQLCQELDERFNAEGGTNSAWMTQDLAVMRMLESLIGEYPEVQDWIDTEVFSWQKATSAYKNNRKGSNVDRYNDLKS